MIFLINMNMNRHAHKTQVMNSIASLYSRALRVHPGRNYRKALRSLHRPPRFLQRDHRQIVTSPTLLRPFPRHCIGRAGEFSTMSSAGGDGRPAMEFQLSESSFLKIKKGDITRWSVDGSSDAIINPANEQMLGGGGADGAIHQAAGPELLAACYKVPEVRPGVRCPTGEARITLGFRLPASHVIHTVGPIYDVDRSPEASLTNAYRNSLRVAKENNIQYIAFTAISCGVFRYPYDEAATVAISTIKEFANDFKEVHFVLFSDEIYDVWVRKAKELLEK